MSGITPLLDTLLPQTLARKVDTLTPRLLNEAVNPVPPPAPIKPLHSDGRLNSPGPAGGVRSGSLLRPQPESPAVVAGGKALLPASGATESTLSPAAKMLSSIYSSAPLPPAKVTLPAPFFPAPSAANAAVLAHGLGQSIRDSGLFYESHLASWYRGELPVQQLQREPQMRLLAVPRPAANPDQGTPVRSDVPLLPPDGKLSRPEAKPLPSAPLPAHFRLAGQPLPREADLLLTRLSAAVSNGPPIAAGDLPDLREATQAVVQQQLALLASPLLHWEGEVWAGALLAMLIQIPEGLHQRNREGAGSEQSRGTPGEPAWDAELALELAALGQVKMKLSLQQRALSIAVQVDTEAGVSCLEAQKAALLSQLERCGFEHPQVRFQVVGVTDAG
ncbi:flagellar hook-length control protein FliK [Porticoccus sp.]